MSEGKRKAEEEEVDGEGQEKKKQKVEKPAYTLNVNLALDKEHESKSFAEIIKLPPSALQGLAERADTMLNKFKVNTIEELANWRFYQVAKAISILSEVEEEGGRDQSGESNINAALDKEWETKSFKEILDAPLSALQGLADWADSVLKPLHVKTVGDLANWKYCRWSEALVTLSKFENADHSSR